MQPHRQQPTRLPHPWNFPGKKYWSGLPFPSPRDLPNPGIKPASLVSSALEAYSLPLLLLLLLLSRFSHVQLCDPKKGSPPGSRHPWDSPGKNTGVGCHFLLQCMKVKSESEVAQLCPTLNDPMDCSLPGSSTHGIVQARVLEWGAVRIKLVSPALRGGFLVGGDFFFFLFFY